MGKPFSRNHVLAALARGLLILLSGIVPLALTSCRSSTSGPANKYSYTSTDPDFLGNYYRIEAQVQDGRYQSMTFTVLTKNKEGAFEAVTDSYVVQRCKKTVEAFLKAQDTAKLGDPTGDSNLTIQFVKSVTELKRTIDESGRSQ